MRGFILAAGFGTRLRPITDHLPKALVPVCGTPALGRSLQFVNNGGITSIGVNTHYRAVQVNEFRESSAIPFEIFFEQDKIRGTGGAFDFARDFLQGDDSFFVCNVDIVYAMDLAALRREFMAGDLACCLLAVAPAMGRGTIYYIGENGSYAGVPHDGDPPQGARGADFIGAAFYKKEFLSCITPDTFSVVGAWHEALRRGLKTGVRILDHCYWRDIGSPASLAQVHFDALDGSVKLEIPDAFELDTAQKRCFPKQMPIELRKNIGEYAWVETSAIPDECTITRSVVLGGSVLRSRIKLNNAIVTRYGEVPLEC